MMQTALEEAEAKLIDTEAEEERLAMEVVAQGARHDSNTAIERESHKSATRQVSALHQAEVCASRACISACACSLDVP